MAEAQARVDQQAKVARELGADGHDATELVRVLQQNLDAIKAHRERIFRELSRATATDRPR
jgi:ABC-type transporter Mla subunit MlaD